MKTLMTAQQKLDAVKAILDAPTVNCPVDDRASLQTKHKIHLTNIEAASYKGHSFEIQDWDEIDDGGAIVVTAVVKNDEAATGVVINNLGHGGAYLCVMNGGGTTLKSDAGEILNKIAYAENNGDETDPMWDFDLSGTPQEVLEQIVDKIIPAVFN